MNLREEITKALKDFKDSDGFILKAGLVLDIEKICLKYGDYKLAEVANVINGIDIEFSPKDYVLKRIRELKSNSDI